MEEPQGMTTYFLPALTKEEWDNLKLYFSFYELHRIALSDWAERELIKDSVWGSIIETMPEEVRIENREQSYQLQVLAINDGNWQPYLAYLHETGIMYAKLGFDFHSWFELINLLRRYLSPILIKEEKQWPVTRILNGMDLYLDIVMSNVGEAYLEEKKRTIEQQHKEQEMLNKELEQFVYIASHDLQEPLTTICSFVNILENEYKGEFSGEATEFLTYIKESSSRMTSLINGLLEYSRVGKMSHPAQVDLNELLEELKRDMAANIQKYQASIEAEPLPTMNLPPMEMKLLFQNLVGNAIKFSKKAIPPHIQISAEKEPGHWHFKIKDNGIGIPPPYQQKIFTIFKRLHHKEEYDGTGLGLAHCKKIVESLDGKIWVESEMGQGSTFHFTIAEQAPAASA